MDDLEDKRARRAEQERKRYAKRAKAQDCNKLRHGMAPEEKAAMLAAQHGRCRCCGDPLLDMSKAHVDHCHTWFTVRGLLCGGCKSGLGYFKDDPERLRKAISYLEEHSGIEIRSVEKRTSPPSKLVNSTPESL
jgi:Recombination endonuclease VII